MINRLARPLTGSELRRVRADLAHLARRASGRSKLKELLQVGLAVGVAGVGYSAFTKTPMPFALAGCAVVGGILLCISWLENWRKTRFRSASLAATLRSPVADVVHVKATAFAQFSEYEDLGALYAFQVGPNELFILCGQDYYETGAFPSLEFELVNVPGAFHSVRPLSAKAKPVVTYSEAEMLTVAQIESQRVIPGEALHALSAIRRAVA